MGCKRNPTLDHPKRNESERSVVLGEPFWDYPDWSGGDQLRSGAEPFWMLPPLNTVTPKSEHIIEQQINDIVLTETIIYNPNEHREKYECLFSLHATEDDKRFEALALLEAHRVFQMRPEIKQCAVFNYYTNWMLVFERKQA
jgi:hypothetical protein